MDKIIQIAAKIIAKADGEHPADGVLRSELKKAGVSRHEGGEISRAVFAYYRWFGWVDQKSPIAEQFETAIELNKSFQTNPKSISDEELKRAVPAWINEQVDVSADWLRSLQLEPKLWLRARPEKGRELAAKLGECWIGGEGWPDDAVRYDGSEDLFRTEEFHAGEFELQDISSQAVGLVCNPQPGETWWDACAGEGGKMLHICDLMRNKGLVWASDRVAWRLQKLKRRAARARIFNYRATLWDGGAKLPTKTKFDGILVDAPCSGVGTWQRNPQARWTTTSRDVEELGEIQKRLLMNATPALKPGGKLIYAVCTLTRKETEEVAEAITGQVPGLKPMMLKNPLRLDAPATERLWIWPQRVQGNGMFICGWQRGSA